MHLILTGATGMVGSGVLTHMLSNNSITRVSVLSRRPLPVIQEYEKVNVIVHKDFEVYNQDILSQLSGATGCVWAQGISSNAVPKDEYITITVNYPIAAAKAFSTLGDNFNFVYVSGEGASTEPGMLTTMYGKVKGQTEAALLALMKELPSLNVFSVRPAVVDVPHSHFAEQNHSMPIAQKYFAPIIKPVLRKVYPDGMTPPVELGKFMTGLAMGDGKALEGKGVEGEGRTIGNAAFRRMAGLSGGGSRKEL